MWERLSNTVVTGLSGLVTHTQASETTSLSINGSSRATLGIYSAHEFANEESLVSITQMVKRAPVNPDTLAGYLIDDGVEIVRRGGIKQRFADFNATCTVMKKHRLNNVPRSRESVTSRERNF